MQVRLALLRLLHPRLDLSFLFHPREQRRELRRTDGAAEEESRDFRRMAKEVVLDPRLGDRASIDRDHALPAAVFPEKQEEREREYAGYQPWLQQIAGRLQPAHRRRRLFAVKLERQLQDEVLARLHSFYPALDDTPAFRA